MRYAKVAFEHMGRHFKKGEAVALHDEMVELRPDLFTTKAPDEDKSKAFKKSADEATTPAEEAEK